MNPVMNQSFSNPPPAILPLLEAIERHSHSGDSPEIMTTIPTEVLEFVLQRLNPMESSRHEATLWLENLAEKGWKATLSQTMEKGIFYLILDVRTQLAAGKPDPKAALSTTKVLDKAGFPSLTSLYRHLRRNDDGWRYADLMDEFLHGNAELVIHEVTANKATFAEMYRPLLYFAAQDEPGQRAGILVKAKDAGIDLLKDAPSWTMLLNTFGPFSIWPTRHPATTEEGGRLFTQLVNRIFPGGHMPPFPDGEKEQCASLLTHIGREENLPFFDALVKAGFDLSLVQRVSINQNGTINDLCPLFNALQTGRKKVEKPIRHLLDAQRIHHPDRLNAVVQRRGPDGETALHWAARNREIAVLDLLLEAGADPLAVDNAGNTLAHWLMRKYSPRHEKEFVPVLQWMQSKGVDLLAPNKKGQTPMAKLARKGTLDSLVAMLEQTGSKAITASSGKGKTAMAVLYQRDDGADVLPLIEKVMLEDSLQLPDATPTSPKRRL